MKKRCILKAPAKLNLHLQVGSRRQDGFHDIKSLFIMVDLYDEIDMRSLKTGNDCKIIGNFNCAPEDNLIYRAWREFCNASGEKIGVEFVVDKKIPSMAGLGGGSSDAAAVLKAMNLLTEGYFNSDELAGIAGRIGSDVPFFLTSPAALIGGRGERIKEMTQARKQSYVIIHPEIGISTAEAYGWLDSDGSCRKTFYTDDEIIGIYQEDISGYGRFFNDFSKVLHDRYTEFDKAVSSLYKYGAQYSSVTGSGSAVFGLFGSCEDAENAEKQLQNEYKFAQKINSLDRIPYAILE